GALCSCLFPYTTLFRSQARAVAPELRAVHAATGVARAPVAGACGEFQHGVVVGRPADRGVGVPLAPRGRHARAPAIGVIVGFRAVAVGTQVAERIARGGVEHLVVAARRTGEQAAAQLQAGRVETFAVALE